MEIAWWHSCWGTDSQSAWFLTVTVGLCSWQQGRLGVLVLRTIFPIFRAAFNGRSILSSRLWSSLMLKTLVRIQCVLFQRGGEQTYTLQKLRRRWRQGSVEFQRVWYFFSLESQFAEASVTESMVNAGEREGDGNSPLWTAVNPDHQTLMNKGEANHVPIHRPIGL